MTDHICSQADRSVERICELICNLGGIPMIRKKLNGGFSLVELSILIITLTVTGTVVVPICHSRSRMAARCEVDASLAAVRTHLNAFQVQNGHYPVSEGSESVMGAVWNDLKPGELTGRYFQDSAYTYQSDSLGRTFFIACDCSDLLESRRVLDHGGVYSDR